MVKQCNSISTACGCGEVQAIKIEDVFPELCIKNIVSAARITKKVSCRICFCYFLSKTALHEHMVHPHGDISCDICGKRYKNPRSLRRHMSEKHPVGGLHNLTCDTCKKVFKDIKYIETHRHMCRTSCRF